VVPIVTSAVEMIKKEAEPVRDQLIRNVTNKEHDYMEEAEKSEASCMCKETRNITKSWYEYSMAMYHI
jgi:hypothetical protein